VLRFGLGGLFVMEKKCIRKKKKYWERRVDRQVIN